MPAGLVQDGDNLSPIGETVTWTDIDLFDVKVEAVTITRGRRDELERTPTGTCTIQANSRTGFTSTFDARQIRVRLWNPVLDTWTVVFRGNVADVRYDFDPSQSVVRYEFSCVDILDYLAGYEFDPSNAGHPDDRPDWASEGDIYYLASNPQDRINSALNSALVPTGSDWRDIFSGNVVLFDVVYPPRTTALEVMQDAAEAEFPGVANIYASKSGVVTFHGRRARFFPDVAEYDIDEWTVGDEQAIEADPTGVAQIRGLSYVRDRAFVINAAMATPQGIEDDDIAAQIFTDTGSITTHGLHSWSAENLLTAGHITESTDALEETRRFAEYYVLNYGDPQNRITNLAIRSLRPGDPRAAYTWRVLTEIEISDIVHVITSYRDPAGFDPWPDALIEDYFVEGIRYEIRPAGPDFDDVTMTLDLSPASYYDNNPFDDDPEPS